MFEMVVVSNLALLLLALLLLVINNIGTTYRAKILTR